MKKCMKSTLKLSLLATLLLVSCGQYEAIVESKQPEKELSIVEQKNAQEWEDGRVYITEHNYVRYQNNNGKPRHYVFKAKEWPSEDLSNESSYDLPRIVFRWDNGEGETDDYYERKDKVWSIKTDGTDLRLVSDEFDGEVRVIRISPNNRYLAISYSSSEGKVKAIKDLKTGEYIELGKEFGRLDLLWSENSDYLYFYEGRQSYKYDLSTRKIEKVDVHFSQDSVIYNGKRIVVADVGIVIYDELSGERLYSITPNKSGKVSDIKFNNKSISPTGRYVWAETFSKRYLIDTYSQSISEEDIDKKNIGKYQYFNIIGLGAKYTRVGSGQVTLFKLNSNRWIDDKYIQWIQVATGNSATESSLYNAFANNGNFEKKI